MIQRTVIWLAVTVLVGCASDQGCATYQWVNYDANKSGQAALNRDWFDCSNYADYKTSGQSEAAAQAAGSAARLGGAGAGLAQTLSGILLVDSAQNGYREACMRARGWTKVITNSASSPTSKKIKEYQLHAKEYFDKKDWPALEELSNQWAKEDKTYEPFQWLAKSQFNQSKFKEALSSTAICLERNPSNDAIIYCRGIRADCHYLLKDFDSSFAELNNIISMNINREDWIPSHDRIAMLLSEKSADEKNWDSALKWQKEVINKDSPRFKASRALVKWQKIRNDRDNSRPEELKEILKIFRDFASSGAAGSDFFTLTLGIMYATGEGTEVNMQAANDLFLSAAKSGIPRAQFYYGRNLLNGTGLDRDRAAGLYWIGAAFNNPAADVETKNLAKTLLEANK